MNKFQHTGRRIRWITACLTDALEHRGTLGSLDANEQKHLIEMLEHYAELRENGLVIDLVEIIHDAENKVLTPKES